PEESSSNLKPWHKDWDAITSNYSEENTINDDVINDDGNAINDDDKYRYNRKGFRTSDSRRPNPWLSTNGPEQTSSG
ncbi:hypothetical protein Tco_0611965, partial [Tanacetum coccineum]